MPIGEILGAIGGIAGLFDGGGGGRQRDPFGFEVVEGGEELLQDILTRGRDIAGQRAPFAPELPFTLSPEETALLEQLRTQGFQPQFGFGQRAGEALDLSQQLLGGVQPAVQQAQADIAAGRAPLTEQEILQSIQQFQNPFIQQVVDPALADIGEVFGKEAAGLSAEVSGAGAFGGSRAETLGIDLSGRLAQERARASGQLRFAGFESASRKALSRLQTERSNFLTAAGLGLEAGGVLGQTGLGAGRLGGQFAEARLGTEDFRIDQLKRQLEASTGLAAPRRSREAGEFQERQIPLKQLDFLRNIFQTIPTSTTSGVAGQQQSLAQQLTGVGQAIEAGGELGADFGQILEQFFRGGGNRTSGATGTARFIT